jgi:type II secretory pathway pseudopilin PulG
MSLVEVMVTLAVLGVMVSLAVMGIQEPLARQRERDATRELWSAALRGRQQAVSTNQPVRIVVENNVRTPDGTLRTVARWERLQCENVWNNNTCPRPACENTTCRANAGCCDAVGPDIVLPTGLQAGAVHGLCFMPGSGRAVHPGNIGCLRGQLDSPAVIKAATVSSLPLNFTTGRARTLLLVEPLTGLTEVLDCDSKLAETRNLAACR